MADEHSDTHGSKETDPGSPAIDDRATLVRQPPTPSSHRDQTNNHKVFNIISK